MIEGSRALSSPAIIRVVRGCALVLGGAGALILIVLVTHGVGFNLDHLVAPFLHPRDRANLPIIAQSLQGQFPLVGIWMTLLAGTTIWYIWGLSRDRWVAVFAALTVSISASLYFANALFHPLLARERTYKSFMLGVRSMVQDAPLYFYHPASDYGAIFYADRHIPEMSQDALPQPSDVGDVDAWYPESDREARRRLTLCCTYSSVRRIGRSLQKDSPTLSVWSRVRAKGRTRNIAWCLLRFSPGPSKMRGPGQRSSLPRPSPKGAHLKHPMNPWTNP